MRYYWMMYNYEQGDRQKHIGSLKTLNNNMQDYTVCCGKYVDNWNPNITLVCDNKEETVVPDWLCDVKGWVVVSQRFIDTIKPFENGGIQYLPIKVDAVQPQMQTEKYYVANVTRVLDVYDYENGDWDYLGPNDEDRDIVTYVLKRDAIGDNHIFIIKEDVLSELIVVSEEVKNAIVKAKLLGFSFFEFPVV